MAHGVCGTMLWWTGVYWSVFVGKPWERDLWKNLYASDSLHGPPQLQLNLRVFSTCEPTKTRLGNARNDFTWT